MCIRKKEMNMKTMNRIFKDNVKISPVRITGVKYIEFLKQDE